MELTYHWQGDYLIPDLILSERAEENIPLGRYARLHRAYLKEHRPILYNQLLLTERLYPLLREIDEAADNRRRLGVSEEAILAELVYC